MPRSTRRPSVKSIALTLVVLSVAVLAFLALRAAGTGTGTEPSAPPLTAGNPIVHQATSGLDATTATKCQAGTMPMRVPIRPQASWPATDRWWAAYTPNPEKPVLWLKSLKDGPIRYVGGYFVTDYGNGMTPFTFPAEAAAAQSPVGINFNASDFPGVELDAVSGVVLCEPADATANPADPTTR